MKKRFILNAEVIGDGAKYIRLDGELIQFVARSATERLHHGDVVPIIVEERHDPRFGTYQVADLSSGAIPVGAAWEKAE